MGRILRKISSHVPKRAKGTRDTSKRRLSKENNKRYNDFIDDVHAKIQGFIKEGAQRFNKPVGTVRNRVFTKTRLTNPKELVWQAYVHVRSKEINEGKAEGERTPLKNILQIIAAEKEHYSTRPDEEKEAWIRALQEHKADRDVQKRRDRKGEEIDHAHTMNHLAHEMEAAEMRYGLQSFYMAVRSDVQQRINPVILCSDNVKEFIALFMGKTPEQMVRMMELWAVNGAEGITASQRKNAKQLRSEIRHFVQMKLNIILSAIKDFDDIVEMNYASYETAIVARYGVRLVGWTYGEVCNPGEISAKADLEQLHVALINKTCRWERVPEEERAELVAGAQPRVRQERSDKGKPRGPYKKRNLREADKENASGAVQAAAKGRAAKAGAAKKRTAATNSGAPKPAEGVPAGTPARMLMPSVPAPPAQPAAARMPTPAQMPAPAHMPAPIQMPPIQMPAPVRMPTPAQMPAPTHMLVPTRSLAPTPGPVPAHMLVPSHMPAPAPGFSSSPAGLHAHMFGTPALGFAPVHTMPSFPDPPYMPGPGMF